MNDRLAEIDREIARLYVQIQELKHEKQRILEQHRLEWFEIKYGIEVFIGMELLNNMDIERVPNISYLHGVYQDSATIGNGADYGWRTTGIRHDDIVTMRKAWLEKNS